MESSEHVRKNLENMVEQGIAAALTTSLYVGLLIGNRNFVSERERERDGKKRSEVWKMVLDRNQAGKRKAALFHGTLFSFPM